MSEKDKGNLAAILEAFGNDIFIYTKNQQSWNKKRNFLKSMQIILQI